MTASEISFLVMLFLPLFIAFGRMIPPFQAGSMLVICIATLAWLFTHASGVSDYDLGSMFVTWQVLLTIWAVCAQPAPEEWFYDR